MRRPKTVCGRFWLLFLPFLAPAFASAQGPLGAPRRPEVWAIVVGVGDYKDPAIRGSATAAPNAGEVFQWIRQAGWDSQHLLLLRDFGNPDPGQPNNPAPSIQPLRQNLDWAFRQWLFPKARPVDLVVFYYAGRSRAVVKPQEPQAGRIHAAARPQDTRLQIEPRVDYYLLPTDAIADKPEQKGWLLDQAIDACARRKL